MPAGLTVVDKEPIAFRTNRLGHRYPLFGGAPDQAVRPRRKRRRGDELFPVPEYFAPALEHAVSEHWCSRENRKMLKVALQGGSLVLESTHWKWRRHACECCSVNDFGLAFLIEKVLGITAEGTAGFEPVLAVVAASKRTGGGTASQITKGPTYVGAGVRVLQKRHIKPDVPASDNGRRWGGGKGLIELANYLFKRRRCG